MDYRLIQAPNMKQAMVKIHQEMGPDALIYRTRKSIGGIEVLAGLPGKNEQSANITNVDDQQVTSYPADVVLEDRIEALNKKIEILSKSLESGYTRRIFKIPYLILQSGFKKVVKRLKKPNKHMLNQSYIMAKDKVMTIGKLLANLGLKGKYQIVETNHEKIEERSIRALVGPPGVGKTSSIIKLAVQFSTKYELSDLGIISTNIDDLYIKSKLLHFCDLYNVDYVQLNSLEKLNETIEGMANKRLVLIDTHGISQRDIIAINKQKQLLEKASKHIDVYLVLAASQQAEVIEDCIKYYRFKRIAGCILTKVDEAIALEPALAAIAKCKLSVSYVTNGEDLDSDIYTLTHNYQSELNGFENIINFGMREFTTQSINWI